MCTYPLVFVQFYLEHIASIVDSGLRGLLPTICRDTRVLSRALVALGSLQLGSRVCVRVSRYLWYLRSLLHFILIVHMRVLTLKAQTAANINFPGYPEYTFNFKYYFLWSWSFLGIYEKKLTHEPRTYMEISIDMNRECTHFTHSNNNYYITHHNSILSPPPLPFLHVPSR